MTDVFGRMSSGEKQNLSILVLAHDPVIHKLRWNEPLCKDDLDALEKLLVKAGAGTSEELSKTRSDGGWDCSYAQSWAWTGKPPN